MQKKSNTKSRELELYELLKILWDGKIKILIVVLILVATSAGLDLRNEESTSYRISLDIKPSKRSEFIRFIPVNALIEKTNEKTAYKRFEEEFLDYEELITVLKKNSLKNLKKIKKQCCIVMLDYLLTNLKKWIFLLIL